MCTQARKTTRRTAWMDNINTGLYIKESIKMTEDRDKESTSMVWLTLGSRTAKEQNRTEQNIG